MPLNAPPSTSFKSWTQIGTWVLWVLLPWTAQGFSLEEFSYELFNEKCPPITAAKSPPTEKCLVCEPAANSADRMQGLNVDLEAFSEEAFLSSLAKERAAALGCTQVEISDLLKSPPKLTEFIDDVSNKLIMLGYLNKKIAMLSGSVGADRTAAQAYKKVRLAQEAIKASLPYAQSPALRLIYNHLASQSDLFSSDGVEAYFHKNIQESLLSALQSAQKQILADKAALERGVQSLGASLDNDLRKSLAQDTELLEGFRQKNKGIEGQLKPVACRVDAKYGTGARYVHETVVFTGTAAIGGLSGLGLKFAGGALAGAVGADQLSAGSATLLRLAAAGAALGATSSLSLYDACLRSNPLGGASKTCGGTGLHTLPQTNCFMTVITTATGAFSGIRGAQPSVRYFEAKKEIQVAGAGPARKTGVSAKPLPPTREPILYLDEVPGQEVRLISAGGKTKTVPVLKYDMEAAQGTGLSVAEVTALRSNFSETLPVTGQMGLFRTGKNLVLDADANILGAYAKFSTRLSSGKPLTHQDFIDVRTKSMESVVDHKGEGIVSTSTQLRGKSTASLNAEIPPYVQERLRHYGIDFKIQNGKTKILYPNSDPKGSLEKLAQEVNRMISEGHPAEKITSFVVQDLLILHPFRNGNGRTARLIGQALYKNLTNQDIAFPPAFFKEMEHSVDELAQTILPKFIPTDNLQNIVRHAYAKNPQVLPEVVPIEKIKSAAPRTDVPFPQKFSGFKSGEKVQYSKLPIEARTNDKPLFYGRPGGNTVEASENEAIKIMKFGRGSRDPNPTLDVGAHTQSTNTKYMPTKRNSGFFSATENPSVAITFSQGKVGKLGIVFVIDPKGAEVLNLHKLPGNMFQREKEVLFGSRLNPARIQAAYIIDNKGNIVKILKNPEYTPRK